MEKLSIKLENCYGIKKVEKEFYFNKCSANVIYAKNGLMKTSLTKVFKKFQDSKEDDIKDEIFNNEPVIKDIKIDEGDINKESVFVIQSFEKSYESSSIASLLINNSLKEELENILSLRVEFLKILEKKSGLRISRVSAGKKIFELEPQILSDFNFDKKSFFQNLENFDFNSIDYDFSATKYSNIFDATILKKIKSSEFQTKVKEYLDKSDEIYREYDFFEKGKFTLPKLKDVQKRLKGNNFFVRNNKIILDGSGEFKSEKELNIKIKEIETKLQETDEFKAIEKLLSDAKGMILKDEIENHPEIIEELRSENLNNFRKKLWLSYIKAEESKFNILKNEYLILKGKIDSLDIDETPWKEAINIFNDRFTLPYKMEIENLTSSIIGESLPKVVFSFCDKENFDDCDNNDWVKLNRDELEKVDTLSQGEKRALYLLNIIFDVEKRKKERQKTLFIIDDIADSFDYKNKYAIVEYLKDISQIEYFYMLILSHNFDFYRTISGRLGLNRENKFHAIKNANEIIIEQEHYQGKPFEIWRDVLKAKTYKRQNYSSINAKKHIIALIPFVRNLIEYGVDKEINSHSDIGKDFIFLTHLLHLKEHTKNIDFSQLKVVFHEYIGKDDFDESINDADKPYNLIIDLADNHISDTDTNLENKIIMAMAIRLIAEEFMIKEINDCESSFIFNWKERRDNKTGNKTYFLNFINSNGNQTRRLFDGYRQIGDIDKIKLIESVSIMTPENIHLNSFMYEPILDMDIIELKKLYVKIKSLLNGE